MFIYSHGGCNGLANQWLGGRAYVSFTVNEEGGQRCYQWLGGLCSSLDILCCEQQHYIYALNVRPYLKIKLSMKK